MGAKAPCFVKEIKMNIVEPIRSKKDLRKIESILKKQSLRDLLIFTIGTNCGLRISDILNLNVGDVRGKTYINIIEKKTSKPKRFPINTKLKPMLENFTKGRRDNEPLFLSYLNNRMERTQCYRIIRDVCKEAGIEYKVGTHTLRKTFGYHHYQKFHDVAVLQKIFNHYSPQITLRYIGIDQDMIDESYNNFIL
jgi:integrase